MDLAIPKMALKIRHALFLPTFPLPYTSPATHSSSSLTDMLLSPLGTLPRLFPLPWILSSLCFIHRTPTNPLGLSCRVNFPRVSSPSHEIPVDVSLINGCIASCNFLHVDCPPVVITEPLEYYSMNVLFLALISVPTTVVHSRCRTNEWMRKWCPRKCVCAISFYNLPWYFISYFHVCLRVLWGGAIISCSRFHFHMSAMLMFIVGILLHFMSLPLLPLHYPYQ